jgi:hypothetical protein
MLRNILRLDNMEEKVVMPIRQQLLEIQLEIHVKTQLDPQFIF